MTVCYNNIPEIQEWIDIVEQEKYKVCLDQKKLIKHVKHCFETENIYVDIEQLNNYMALAKKYIPFDLFPWQKFVIALHCCTYWTESGMPRWNKLMCMIGRGAGKDGTIASISFLLTSPYNNIREYDIDICANNEEQAIRPVEDLIGFFELPSVFKKIKRFYNWTKQGVVSLKTKSIIKGRTNSPKGKDGLRSGAVVFNEIHQYENYDNINVFTTGLGKKKHPRRSYFTTNGDVREGPLDDILDDAKEVLDNGANDNGMLYFLCRLDSKEEVHNEENWTKSNPSLPYLPHLLNEIRDEYREWKENPNRLPAFMSKRMNLPEAKKETAVTDWDNIKATNVPLPDLKGWSCTVGIDYSKTNDWAAVNFHFKNGDMRYDINRVWMCSASADIPRLSIPWEAWVDEGRIEYVDDVEIHPSIIARYIQEMGRKYNILKVGIDSYRYSLLSDALSKIGISKEHGNLILVKQTDIIKVVPVIEHCFTRHYFVWGDNIALRWATNNTKLIPYGKKYDANKGSFVYAKIDAHKRKTDPFMALVASMVCEGEIKDRPKINRKIGVIKSRR